MLQKDTLLNNLIVSTNQTINTINPSRHSRLFSHLCFSFSKNIFRLILKISIFLIITISVICYFSGLQTSKVAPIDIYPYLMPGTLWNTLTTDQIRCRFSGEDMHLSTFAVDELGAIHSNYNQVDSFYCIATLTDSNFRMVSVYGSRNIVIRSTFYINSTKGNDYNFGDFHLDSEWWSVSSSYNYRTCDTHYQPIGENRSIFSVTIWSTYLRFNTNIYIYPLMNKCTQFTPVSRIVYSTLN